MKAKLITVALVLIIGFTGCTTSYYMTSPGSSNRHRGYTNDYDDNYRSRPGYYNRGDWRYRNGYYPRGDWRYRRAPIDWRYRRW